MKTLDFRVADLPYRISFDNEDIDYQWYLPSHGRFWQRSHPMRPSSIWKWARDAWPTATRALKPWATSQAEIPPTMYSAGPKAVLDSDC